MTELTLKGETYRIRRLDPSNFVIEKYVPPTKADRKQDKWAIIGYYGNLNDLSVGLVKYLTEIPEGKNILEQIALLRQELRNIEVSISQQLAPHHTVKEGIREKA